LATAQQYADEFVLLKAGQVRAQGDLESLSEKFGIANASLDDIYMAMSQEGARA
jgi:ABC-2 type transport system ATP-binding protein